MVIDQLNRISKNAAAYGRRVIFNNHRWHPSRLRAVTDLLALKLPPLTLMSTLFVIEEVMWFQPTDIDQLKDSFSELSVIRDVYQPAWGQSIGFLLS